MKKTDKGPASFDVPRRYESAASYKTPGAWNRGSGEFINRAINQLESGTRGSRKSSDAFFRDQEGSRRGADHLIKQGMEIVQGSVERPPVQVAAPDLQGNALVGFPSMYIVSIRTGEAFNPDACLSQVVNGLRLLTGEGVERDGHENRFVDANQLPPSVKDLRSSRNDQKKSKRAGNWRREGPGVPVPEVLGEIPPRWRARPRG